MVAPDSTTIAIDPEPVRSLHGRDADLARIRALLDSSRIRLLTLTGPGGVGKTRLAEAVVGEIAGDYVDGAVMVSLAPLQEAAQIVPAIAHACGVPDRGSVDALATALQPRHLLLYLDNFEHVLDPAPTWLAELIVPCPRLTLLVTSRVPLHLQREQRYPVAPLAVPDLGESGTTPAETLFIERARAVRPDFAPNDRTREAIAAICRHLDGLPLAIELAAARTAVLSPEEVLARLPDRLDLLSGGPRDVPIRQQSLEATIAWSYDLLPDEHQRLFRQVSVFQGGFTLAAAEAVCGPRAGPITDVLSGVTAVVDHSLLQAVPVRGGTTRYRMLETIRAFGLAHLVASGKEQAVRDAHAVWCLSLATHARESEDRIRHAIAIDDLEADHANFLAALTWLAESRQGEHLLRLVHALEYIWYFGGYDVEGLAWYRHALDLAPEAPPMERLAALLSLVNLAHRTNHPETDNLIAQARGLAEAVGTPTQIADAEFNMGLRAEDTGNYSLAEVWTRKARDRYQQAGAEWDVVMCDYHLGVIALGNGDLPLAQECLEGARQAGAALNDPFTPLWALMYLVLIACERGDEPGATALLRQHPALDRLGYQHHRDMLRAAAGALSSLRGDHQAAVRLFTAANDPHVLYEPERSIAERALGRARNALGEARFAAARERGLRLRPRDIEAEIARLLAPVAGSPGEGAGPAPVGIRSDSGAADLLSPREREVLVLLAQGKTNAEIADTLFISTRTAASHVGSILTKLDLNSRTAAVAWAIRHGLA